MSKLLNVEIKAKCNNAENVRNYLKSKNAQFIGLDHQVDTYLNCPEGRLKLRQGNIENSLIFYQRQNQQGPKTSNIRLAKMAKDNSILDVLTAAYGIKIIIDKKREIYFIDNVKFHIDYVEGLGSFIEIEAIDSDGTLGLNKIETQCQYYLNEFLIRNEDLISESYSDMLQASR